MLKTIRQSQGIPANLTKWQNLWCKRRAEKAIQASQIQAVPNIGFLNLYINFQSKGSAGANPVNQEFSLLIGSFIFFNHL